MAPPNMRESYLYLDVYSNIFQTAGIVPPKSYNHTTYSLFYGAKSEINPPKGNSPEDINKHTPLPGLTNFVDVGVSPSTPSLRPFP